VVVNYLGRYGGAFLDGLLAQFHKPSTQNTQNQTRNPKHETRIPNPQGAAVVVNYLGRYGGAFVDGRLNLQASTLNHISFACKPF
jgi:hypothetical protein